MSRWLGEVGAFVWQHLTIDGAVIGAIVLLLVVGRPLWLLTLLTWLSPLSKRLAPAGERRLNIKLGQEHLKRAKRAAAHQNVKALDHADQAVDLFKNAHAAEPSRERLGKLLVEAHLARARIHAQTRNLNALANDLQGMIEFQPAGEPFDAMFFSYLAEEKIGNLNRAVEIAKQAFAKFPESAKVRQELIHVLAQQGDVYNQTQQLEPLIRVSTELIELDPTIPTYYFVRATAKRKVADFEGALLDARKLLELDPDSPDGQLSAGLSLLGLGQYAEADRHLTKAIEIQSADDALAHWGRAQARLGSADYAGAVEDYSCLIDEFRSDRIEYYEGRAEAYFLSGSYDEALDDFNRIASRDSPSATSMIYRGDIYLFRDEYQKAFEDYRRAASLDPDDLIGDYGAGLALIAAAKAQEPAAASRETLKDARRYLYDALAKAQKTQVFSALYRNLSLVEDGLGNFEVGANLREEARRIERGVNAEVPFEERWGAVQASFENPELPSDLNKTLLEFAEAAKEAPENARENYGAALLYLKNNDRPKAVEYLNRVLTIDPGFADAYYWRAWARAQGQDWLGSLADANMATSLNPSMSTAHYLRGIAYSNLNHLPEALNELRKAVELNPNYMDARRDLVWTLAQSQNWPEVIDNATAAIQHGIRNHVIYTLRAEAYRMTSKIGESISDSTEALALAPEYPLAYRTRGLASLLQNEFDQALADLKKFVELAPEDASAYVSRADALRLKGRLDDALTDIEHAIELSPHLASAYYVRGWIHYQKGAWDAASSNFSKGIDLGLSAAETKYAYYGRAECSRIKGQWEAAMRDYTQAITQDSSFAIAYYGRATARAGNQEWDGAISDFSKALEHTNEKELQEVQVLTDRAWSYFQRGLDDFALQDLNRALEVNPNSISARVTRGNVFIYSGRPAEAIEEYTRVIQIDEKSSLGHQNRGIARCYTGDLENAIIDLAAAVEIEPTNGHIFDGMAWAKVRLKRWQEALAHSQRALELDPQWSFSLMNRSLASWWLGDPKQAAADLKAVIGVRLANLTLAVPCRKREDAITWGAVADDWGEAVVSKPDDAIANFGRGISRWMSNDLLSAIRDMEKALTQASDPDVARVIELVQREAEIFKGGAPLAGERSAATSNIHNAV